MPVGSVPEALGPYSSQTFEITTTLDRYIQLTFYRRLLTVIAALMLTFICTQ